MIHVLPETSEREAFRDFMHSDPDMIYGCDVETTAITDKGVFDPAARMRLIQFGTKTDAYVLDPHIKEWREYICRALNSPTHRFVSHTNYDVLWCRREFGVDLAERGIDTHVLACLVDPGERRQHDLKSLSSRYIDDRLIEAETALHARFKELAPVHHRVGSKMLSWGFTNIPLDDPAYSHYAGLDAIYVRRLLDLLDAEVTDPTFAALCRREQVIKRLANDVQWRGHLVDREYTRGVLAEIEHEYQRAYDAVVHLTGLRPKSSKMSDWLAKRGVVFTARTPTGRGKLDKDNLPLLAQRYQNNAEFGPIFENLLTISSRQNMLNNLRSALANSDANGFIHPSINTCQAVTGRMSVTDVPMQTFKKTDARLRGCFIARPGHVFVGADYDGQELRLAAAFSRDKMMLDIIARGIKQHVVTATRVFGKDYDGEQYKHAKILNFMQQYMGGPGAIGDAMGMPRSKERNQHGKFKANPEAVKLWLAWRETYAGFIRWSEKIAERRVVVNPWGRRIPRDRFRPYANGNMMIQSSGRDVLGDASVALQDSGWDRYLWLWIHDEIVLEVPEEWAHDALEALESAMYAEVGGIPLPAVGKIIGKRWSGE